MVRGFRSFHPIILLLYYIYVVAGLMLYQHPFFLFTAFCVIICFNVLLDGGAQLKKWGFLFLVMSSFVLILTPLFNRRGNHILFYLFDNPVMLEAIIQGVMIALTLVCILSIFVTFNMVLTADKFLFLFSKVFVKWAMLIMLSMRFVPLLRKRVKDIQQVQQIKGLSIKQGPIKQRAKNGMLLIQVLLTFSLEESLQTADSMTTRGYGIQKRSKYQPYFMETKDWVVLLVMSLLFGLIVFGWWLGDGVLMLMPFLEEMWLTSREWFYLIIWLVFIGFPVYAEGKEVLKWKYYQQKM